MGERVIVYETTEEGWAWGQIESDGYVGWMSANALAAPGAAPTHKVAALRTLGFPGPDIMLPPAAALPMGALLAIARRGRALLRHAVGAAYSVRASGVDAGDQGRLRHRRRIVPRHALSVGRQDLAGHRLLGIWCRSPCRPPAWAARATATCRKWRWASRRRSPNCAVAISCSGRGTSPSPATRAVCCMPMPITWPWRSSRPRTRSRASRRAGSDVTSVKRL